MAHACKVQRRSRERPSPYVGECGYFDDAAGPERPLAEMEPPTTSQLTRRSATQGRRGHRGRKSQTDCPAGLRQVESAAEAASPSTSQRGYRGWVRQTLRLSLSSPACRWFAQRVRPANSGQSFRRRRGRSRGNPRRRRSNRRPRRHESGRPWRRFACSRPLLCRGRSRRPKSRPTRCLESRRCARPDFSTARWRQ